MVATLRCQCQCQCQCLCLFLYVCFCMSVSVSVSVSVGDCITLTDVALFVNHCLRSSHTEGQDFRLAHLLPRQSLNLPAFYQ